MTREEAIAFGKRVIDLGFKDETAEFCEMAISALSALSENKGDLISRQAVLAIVMDSCLDLDKWDDTDQFCKEIEELPSAENKEEWIPVSERLPEESQTEDGYFYPSDMVLTFNSHGQYGVSRYWGNRISKKERPKDYLDWMDLPFYRQDILAWQPLPEPYKERGESE